MKWPKRRTAFFEAAERRNLYTIAGIASEVLMARSAPDYLCDTAYFKRACLPTNPVQHIGAAYCLRRHHNRSIRVHRLNNKRL